MLKSRPRLISAALALVSIGLFASLLPQTSFVPRPSGGFADAIGPVGPDNSIEQPLDGLPDVISEVRVWARAGFDRGEAPIAASILRAESREPVRQVKARISPSKLLAPYVLTFPPYMPAPGEKLALQLWISTERENSVVFAASEPSEDAASPILNGQPMDYGPLAYEFIWTGASWRAALEGSIPDLARLAAAVAAALVAVALRPFISRTLRKAIQQVRTAFLTISRPVYVTLQRAQASLRPAVISHRSPSQALRLLLLPLAHPRIRDTSLPRQQPPPLSDIGLHRSRGRCPGDRHSRLYSVPTCLQDRGRGRRAYGSARNGLLLVRPYPPRLGRACRR